MPPTSIVIDASPDEVFAVLADGWSYSNWVVGTSHIRAVDSEWPAPGAKLYHAVGGWPVMTRDETAVVSARPGEELVLNASGSPLGAAVVTLTLQPDAQQCRVTMAESPSAGPAKWLHNPLTEAMLTRRNHESLRRLQATVERRAQPSE